MNVPISLTGLLAAWVGADAGFGSAVASGSSERLWLRRTDDLTNAVDGTITAGLNTLPFQVPAAAAELDVAFALPYMAGDVFKIDLSGTPSGLNLTGYLTIEPGLLVAPSGDDLTTLAAVKAFMGISDSSFDTYLSNLITALSTRMQKHMDRLINTQVVVDEFIDSAGFEEVRLLGYPVQSVESVEVAASLLDPTEYRIDAPTGLLRRLSGDIVVGWLRGLGIVKVDYTYGFTTTPMDLVEACNHETARVFDWSKQGAGRLALEGTVLPLGGSSTYQLEAWLPSTLQTMSRYKAWDV